MNSSFSGKVKFVFTVEEEIGLVGARAVEDYFLWDVDAAIVVDRRNEHDIVVSCRDEDLFCHEKYGKFFETITNDEGMEGWRCTPGGSSDARIWAEHHIESVNLSAGYRNEHTEEEELDIEACYGTVKLLQAVFEHSRELRQTLREVRRHEFVNAVI